MTRYHWLWLGAAIGLALHALGLGWDVYMHAQDSTLAAREGIFTIENPSHALIVAGVAIATVCIIGVAITWLNERHIGGDGPFAMALRVSSLPMIAVVGAASIWLVSLSEDSSSHAHDDSQADGTVAHVHDDGSEHMHDASLDQWVLNALAAGGVALAVDDHTHAAASPGQPTGSEAAPGVLHDHGEVVAVTNAELEAAYQLVANTKAAAVQFEDLENSLALGYYQVAPPRRGLTHYMNSAYNRDGLILDPEHPESLIYLTMADGSAKLVGVMYRMPNRDEPGPRVGGALTAWHAHDNLCTEGGKVVAVASDGICAKGTLSRTPEMLHVWLFDNPDGVFSDDMEPSALVELQSLGNP